MSTNLTTFQEHSDQQIIQQLRDTLAQTEEKLHDANDQIDSLKEQVCKAEEFSKGLLEELNNSKKLESCKNSDAQIV